MKTPRDHAASLLFKASHDLIAARAILAAGDAFDTVCFHAQQTVEKSLKAVLALYEIEYPRRHDLGELLELAKPLTPDLGRYGERVINWVWLISVGRLVTCQNVCRRKDKAS